MTLPRYYAWTVTVLKNDGPEGNLIFLIFIAKNSWQNATEQYKL